MHSDGKAVPAASGRAACASGRASPVQTGDNYAEDKDEPWGRQAV